MTDDKKGYAFGDDLPKTNPWEEDRLGYAPFAERICEIVAKINAPNGYVIGLHGQWGSGKSTLINFIIQYLGLHNKNNPDDTIIHIDFRPWIVSGHQDLISAFFKILSENLGPKNGRWKRRGRAICGWFRGNTDNLVDAAGTVALAIDPSAGVASGIAGKFVKGSLNVALDRFLKEPSLQKAYEDLNAQLVRRGKRYLITIDDIDRLEESEVKAMFQMVKSIGQLPNVIYLLSYDREIVWNVLDQGVNRQGPRFAEKIIQQEIELPQATKEALLTLLDEETSFLVGGSATSARWEYIVRDGVRRWIKSPRDVVRLSNAVKFSWPALAGC